MVGAGNAGLTARKWLNAPTVQATRHRGRFSMPGCHHWQEGYPTTARMT